MDRGNGVERRLGNLKRVIANVKKDDGRVYIMSRRERVNRTFRVKDRETGRVHACTQHEGYIYIYIYIYMKLIVSMRGGTRRERGIIVPRLGIGSV